MKKIDFNLGEGVSAFSTMRGEIADWHDPYQGFSVCHYCGDDEAHIASCRRQLTDIVGTRLVIPDQTHSTNVAVIRRPDDVLPSGGVDALVSDCPEVALCINTADCVPVLMADASRGIVAAVHSGWRGTVGLIAARAIDAMIELGAVVADIKVVMGPSICADCFEVGQEVADIFRVTFPQTDCVINIPGLKPHVDLHKAIVATLMDCGVKRENISDPALCSHCNPADWFSARRLGIHSGRTISLITTDGE